VFTPFYDRVLLRPLEEGDRTSSGLLIKPDIAKEAPQRGEVLAVGPGRVLDNGVVLSVPCQVGDIVSFGKYSGTRVTLNDEELIVIRATDMLGGLSTDEAVTAFKVAA
jgi:chaperonin GroES